MLRARAGSAQRLGSAGIERHCRTRVKSPRRFHNERRICADPGSAGGAARRAQRSSAVRQQASGVRSSITRRSPRGDRAPSWFRKRCRCRARSLIACGQRTPSPARDERATRGGAPALIKYRGSVAVGVTGTCEFGARSASPLVQRSCGRLRASRSAGQSRGVSMVWEVVVRIRSAHSTTL